MRCGLLTTIAVTRSVAPLKTLTAQNASAYGPTYVLLVGARAEFDRVGDSKADSLKLATAITC